MADPYIDQFETLIYGKFAREQMAEVLLGKIDEVDGAVRFAIKAQKKADDEMRSVLDNQPKPAPAPDTDVVDEARDTIVRFGSYLDSLKGRPVDPKSFFGNEAPSVLARRRLLKLTAAVGHIASEIKAQEKKIRDKSWLSEFDDLHARLTAFEKRQRSMKVERMDVAPDVAAARLRWLETYNANKLLVRGLLAHAGKAELLPLIFDDLAEIHRAAGVSDETPPAPVAPAPGSASRPAAT